MANSDRTADQVDERGRLVRAIGPCGQVLHIPLSGRSLFLGGMGLSEIHLDSVDDLSNIETLWLYDNRITHVDLRPLSSASGLRSLSLARNRLTRIDLSPLAQCNRLTDIDLGENLIESLDLSPLRGLRTLEVLRLGHNPLRALDLSALEGCCSLSKLDITGLTMLCGSPDGCGKDSPASGLDLTSLFMCNSLIDLVIDNMTPVIVDPVLKYVILSNMNPLRGVISSAPRRACMPRMAWLSPSLAGRIYWPDYSTLYRVHGPHETLHRIRRILATADEIYSFHLTCGLLCGFGLGGLVGLDTEPERLLSDLSGDEPYEVARTVVQRNAISLLREQLTTGGPSLFFDVETLLNMGATDLVSLVLDRRRSEVEETVIEDHGDHFDIRDLMLTAYGRSVTKALHVRGNRVSPEILNQIQDVFDRVGIRLRVVRASASRGPKYPRLRFSESLIRVLGEDAPAFREWV
ncbi:MAG: hypothetical protein QXS20_05815 [Candidatus Thorarchaeota archaeon]